mgnify:CR=1 FL=1
MEHNNYRKKAKEQGKGNNIKRVTFNNVVQVYEIHQEENIHVISKRDFYFAKLKLIDFLENILVPRMKLNNK